MTWGKSLPRIPPPPELELLMDDLGPLGETLPRIPLSHLELKLLIEDFGQMLAKNTPHPELEALMEDLGTSGKTLPRILLLHLQLELVVEEVVQD